MDVYFLGTASGTPTKSRNVSAVALIESQGSDWYLVDCGEGTQHQILRSHLSLNSLQAILITHVHGDHCYGLPGLLASAGMSGKRTPITIVAPKGIREWFEATQLHTQLYLPYELNFIATESLVDLTLGQFSISCTTLSHRVPSFAYSFTDLNITGHLDTAKLTACNIPQGPLWGKLQAGLDVEYMGRTFKSSEFVTSETLARKIVICGDNDTPELLVDAANHCSLLIHESTYTQDAALKAREVGHSYARQVAQFAQASAIPNLILTHFSPRYPLESPVPPSIQDIWREALQVYSGQLFLAEDFQHYRLDKHGQLTLIKPNSL